MNRHGASALRLFFALFAAKIAVSAQVAQAQALTPSAAAPRDAWGDVFGDSGVRMRSVVVASDETPIFREASSASARRGTAEAGARLPLFGTRSGAGCRGRWLLVAPDAFVCEDGVELAPHEATPLSARAARAHDGLPHRYFFVQKDGSFGYEALTTAEDGVPSTQLQPGFGVAVRQVRDKAPGDPFGLTTRGFWVPLRDLTPALPISFHGSPFTPELAWVVREGAPRFVAPGRRKPGATLERLTPVNVLETLQRGGVRYLRLGPDEYLRAEDVRKPELVEPPPGIGNGERWLDVDLARQTLVAYSGTVPTFATLISSGRGAAGTETATPIGLHRIWVKLRTSDMDNVEDLEARENYAIEAVPWVMFFERGYGLHGTFWHRRFGEKRSHGCVNLAPLDAEYLFFFTEPRLYPGWTAALPTPRDPGTLIRVR